MTIEGNPMAHAESYTAKSTGNEVSQSTDGGVITHQFQGAAYVQTFSMNVFVESLPAVRHLDLLTHNHMAQMPGNTPPAPWRSAMTAGNGTDSDQRNMQLAEYRAANVHQAIKDVLGDRLRIPDSDIEEKPMGTKEAEEAARSGHEPYRNPNRRRVDMAMNGFHVLTLTEA